MVSLFGESSTDQRDFRMGLAGLLAGIHSLRILAERGLAPPEDIHIAKQGIMDTLSQIPEHEFSPQQREQINEMMQKIWFAAASNFGQEA